MQRSLFNATTLSYLSRSAKNVLATSHLAPRRSPAASFSSSSLLRKKTSEKPATPDVAAKDTPSPDATADAAASASESVKAKDGVKAKDAKIAELQDSYVRCLADMENLRTRTRNEVESSKQYAIQKFAKDLLDTVDVVGMAIRSVPEAILRPTSAPASTTEELHKTLTSFHTGVTLIETELLKALKRHGVEQIEALGQTFDPNTHDAIFQAPQPDKKAGTVFLVQKSGFTLNGRVIRPAQVGVVKE